MQESSPPLIYVFTIRLLEIEPTIWRRIEVPEYFSFWDLHAAIQDAMGWLRNCARNYYPYRPDKFYPSTVVFADPAERLRMMWQ